MNNDMWALILLLLFITGAGVTGYKVGRRVERKDLTKALVKAIEASYWDGFDDGRKR
jgi:hypothetical protein